VTGAAGFIGSNLCEKLLHVGHKVCGVDAFIPYYSQDTKRHNLASCLQHENFRFAQLDLRVDPLEGVVDEADAVFHLAAMPGLVRSWLDFEGYWTCNVLATQRLLEAIKKRTRNLHLLIQASTSSVYGRLSAGDENLPTRPVSPYGVTKLAAEHLCWAYAENHGIPMVVLRYFSVYGPRQRPDMAYHIFINALLRQDPIIVFGAGDQVRGNTYIDDCVSATVRALEARPGETYNVGGGETASVLEVIRKLESISGRPASIRHESARPGDQQYTFADTTKLRSHLGWEPRTRLDDGLARQWQWQEQELGKSEGPPMTK
jgi:nucleoside-diphosphate-sugar epimerase